MKCSCGCNRKQLYYRSGKPVIFTEGSKHCKECGNLCWEKDMKKGYCFDCYIKKPKQSRLI
jgi:hypothetical protein